MTRLVLLGSGTLVLLAISCAKGSTLTGVGGSGTGGEASSSSSSSGAGASGGGASSSSSSSSSGDPDAGTCSEDPCKLTLPQCGCAAGKQCSVLLDGSRGCIKEGNTPWKQSCGQVSKCEPGTMCLSTGGSISMCLKFCDTDAECGGGICARKLDFGQGEIPNTTICTDLCTPSTNMGCAVNGTSCQLGQEQSGQMRFFTYCGGAGNKTQGQLCDPNLAECAPTYSCFNANSVNQCLKYCKVLSPSCPGGTSCVAIQINMQDVYLNGEQYGACL